jgi:hypothetical protein
MDRGNQMMKAKSQETSKMREQVYRVTQGSTGFVQVAPGSSSALQVPQSNLERTL